MKASLARMYLMRALAMTRKKQAEIEQRVLANKCITANCDGVLRSRGLCEKCRQQYYQELKARSEEEQVQLEEDAIQKGMILAEGEQAKILRKKRNPFSTVG